MTAAIPYTFANTPAPYKVPASELDQNFAQMLPELATFATVRALTDVAIPAVWVRGGAAAGDAQQGMFYYDSSDSTTADNGGTVLVDASGHRWKRLITNAVNVKWFGAKGDGTTDDTAAIQAAIDFCFGPASAPHGLSTSLNYALYFPPGTYKITTRLKITSVRGATIYGAGRFTTSITNTAGGDCLDIDGMQYSTVSGIYFNSSGITATVCNIDWTGAGLSTQSNTFYDCFFNGGDKGVVIGLSGLQASEITFIDCFIANAHTYGLTVNNFNALGNNFIGGNIQSCPTGIRCFAGTINVYGTGFQGSTAWDFQSDSSANDAISFEGIRSESLNFVWVQNGMTVSIKACSHINSTNGQFCRIDGQGTVEACTSSHGTIGGAWVGGARACFFGRNDFVGSLLSTQPSIRLQQITYNTNVTNKYITDKTVTNAPAGNFWTSYGEAAAWKPLTAGGTTLRFPIAANTLVRKVTLVLTTAGAAGTVDVGDGSSGTAYFAAQSLAGATTVSATVEKLYAANDEIVAVAGASAGLVGSIVVDYVNLN